MKCRKQLVLTGYRVQFVDLREPLPDAAFINLTEQVIICGRDIADDCAQRYAQFMQESYMSGYNTNKP